MLRSFIEKTFRNVSFGRKLPNGARIIVTPDAALQYFKTGFAGELDGLAKRWVNSDSVVWDIGANCGVLAFSCLHAKEVVAVEPDPYLTHLLLRTNSYHDCKVQIIHCAVSDRVGLAQFTIASRGRASNYLSDAKGRTQAGGERYRFVTPTTTLDQMLEIAAGPTFLKIDVEGAEVDVLRGAEKILSDHRPVIHIEVGKSYEEECRAILEKAGYKIEGELNWLALPR